MYVAGSSVHLVKAVRAVTQCTLKQAVAFVVDKRVGQLLRIPKGNWSSRVHVVIQIDQCTGNELLNVDAADLFVPTSFDFDRAGRR